MATDRRQKTRRSDDDLRQVMERNQFQTERRHVENTQRFDAIEGDVSSIHQKISSLSEKIETHLQDEESTKAMIQLLHDCVDRNAAMIDHGIAQLHKVIADMKDNMLPLLLKDTTKKTWWLANAGQQCIKWLTPVMLFVLTAWALYDYLAGRGPFPIP
jgi:hypothetical protein